MGYRRRNGTISFGKNDPSGYIDRPVKVGCGRCSGCRLENSRVWAVRCMHEAQLHEANSFITLTYDKDELPENASLDVGDWQKFAKRVRQGLTRRWVKSGKNGAKPVFRFFHVGEYGELNGRPHFHALIFGQNFNEDRKTWKKENGNQTYTSLQLEEWWGKGFVVIGDVTWQSASYVSRYCMKKVNGKNAEEHYTRVNEETGEEYRVKPEYATMSRRPGIGAGWIESFSSDVYPADFTISNGKPAKPGKYYDAYMKLKNPQMMEAVIEKRKEEGKKERWNQTPERLAVRERVALAKQKLSTRDV